MMGSLETAGQMLADGTMARHQDNFRLKAGEEKEFCASGPFYAGRKLYLVLRSLVPLFSCRTRIEQPIYLDAKPDEGGTVRLSATCH